MGDSYDNALAESINGFVQGGIDPSLSAVEDQDVGGAGDPWDGYPGLTTDGYSNMSATFRRLKRRQTIISNSPKRPP
jgi:hypothetical protein